MNPNCKFNGRTVSFVSGNTDFQKSQRTARDRAMKDQINQKLIQSRLTLEELAEFWDRYYREHYLGCN